MIITHKNMGSHLKRLEKEPCLQPGSTVSEPPDAWFRKKVILEFPLGELAHDGLTTLALVGRERPDPVDLTGKEGFDAQGLEGKVQIETDLFCALMKLRDILPPYRGRIVV